MDMDAIESILLRSREAPLTLEEALQLATALHRAGDQEPAEQLYRRVLEAAPDHPDALHYLGVLCNDRGDNAEALRLMERSVELVPGHAPFRSNLGNLLLELERFEDAAAAYQQALDLDPERPDTLNNRGVLCKALGRYAEAEQNLLSAIELAPDFADARDNLTGLYLRQGRVDEALAQCAEALKRRPSDARSRELQGYVHARMGRLAEAAEIYRAWLAADPDNPKARHQLAACSGEAVPERASDAYVQLVFDTFSRSFDAKLASLEYRAPTLVSEAVVAALGTASAGLSVLDAGCGTGLCGSLLSALASRLDGVDLSRGMLDKAQLRHLYDDLTQAELTAYMAAHPERYDLVVSADTLVYFGELREALSAAAHTLRPGGLLCFTLEALGDDSPDDYKLQYHGRYAHGKDFVGARISEAGLELLRLERDWLRMEAGQRVLGWLVLARK